jgi:small-conductance mechanosensitive channel
VVGFTTLTGIVAAGYGRILSESAVIIAALTFALGIAGQHVFGSLISGMFPVADPDFNVGDWIEWPGGDGTIEAVDVRVTRVRTPNNETISFRTQESQITRSADSTAETGIELPNGCTSPMTRTPCGP